MYSNGYITTISKDDDISVTISDDYLTLTFESISSEWLHGILILTDQIQVLTSAWNSNLGNVLYETYTGTFDSDGAVSVSLPLDTLWICSYHSNTSFLGGIAIALTSYNTEIIKQGSHNGSVGITIDGYTPNFKIKTDCPKGTYRLIVFKNYEN